MSTLKPTREAVEVNRTQELEKSDAMLRVLREVLVDHAERRLEDSFKYR